MEQSTNQNYFHVHVFNVGARTRGISAMGLNLYIIKAIAQKTRLIATPRQ